MSIPTFASPLAKEEDVWTLLMELRPKTSSSREVPKLGSVGLLVPLGLPLEWRMELILRFRGMLLQLDPPFCGWVLPMDTSWGGTFGVDESKGEHGTAGGSIEVKGESKKEGSPKEEVSQNPRPNCKFQV